MSTVSRARANDLANMIEPLVGNLAVAVQVNGETFIVVYDPNMGRVVVRADDVDAAGDGALESYEAFCNAVACLNENDADLLRRIADELGHTVSTPGGTRYAAVQEVENEASSAAIRVPFELLHVKRLDNGQVQVGRKTADGEDVADEDEAASAELDPRLAELGLKPQGGHLDELGSYYLYA